MHGTAGVWEFEIEIFVNITCGMGEIVSKVIGIHVVVMDEATSVLSLRLQVESDIVPVGRPDFVVGVLRVSEVLRQWQR